jgi:hypothetical protein
MELERWLLWSQEPATGPHLAKICYTEFNKLRYFITVRLALTTYDIWVFVFLFRFKYPINKKVREQL